MAASWIGSLTIFVVVDTLRDEEAFSTMKTFK
jgi:hypothetical protein